MLDPDLKQQLQDVFSKLSGTVRLRMANTSHADQAEMQSLLWALAETAPGRIRLEEVRETREGAPLVEILGVENTGTVTFRGVPGGHEFSSLVLAILHRDGKGQLPDAGITGRIRALQGPIRLRTYVSLSCENCPEVVQALNLMAMLHPDFHHETIDGGIAQDEIESLGIQGVPSVVHDGRLVHSGKIQLLDLVSKLEDTFGKSAERTKSQDLGSFDVAVIGGGPAGASSAIYSVRKGLNTAIITESVGGQLRETQGIENMISVPYTEGAKLAAQLSDHLAQYPVRVFEHRRVSSIGPDTSESGLRKITLESGETLAAKSVIIATGAKWRQLGIPGEKEHIGQGVAFCAHCDGPFYKDKRVVVVGGGNSGVEAAIDLAGIASEVTLLEYSDRLRADGILVEKLKGLSNATIVNQAKSTRVIGDGRKVVGLEYLDLQTQETRTLKVDGVFVQIGLLPNSHFVRDLLTLTSSGEIVVDAKGRTNVSGIYAAGDVTTLPFKQIILAMGDGAKVALSAFEDRLRA